MGDGKGGLKFNPPDAGRLREPADGGGSAAGRRRTARSPSAVSREAAVSEEIFSAPMRLTSTLSASGFLNSWSEAISMLSGKSIIININISYNLTLYIIPRLTRRYLRQ